MHCRSLCGAAEIVKYWHYWLLRAVDRREPVGYNRQDSGGCEGRSEETEWETHRRRR